MSILCPIDGKDDAIQKVSAIVLSGTSTGTDSGPTGGVAHVGGKWGTVRGYSTLSGQTRSDLASTLALPPKPKAGGTLKTIFSMIVVLAWFGLSIWLAVGAIAFAFGNGFGSFDRAVNYALSGCLLLGALLLLVGADFICTVGFSDPISSAVTNSRRLQRSTSGRKRSGSRFTTVFDMMPSLIRNPEFRFHQVNYKVTWIRDAQEGFFHGRRSINAGR